MLQTSCIRVDYSKMCLGRLHVICILYLSPTSWLFPGQFPYGAHNMTKLFEFELCKFELLASVI